MKESNYFKLSTFHYTAYFRFFFFLVGVGLGEISEGQSINKSNMVTNIIFNLVQKWTNTTWVMQNILRP